MSLVFDGTSRIGKNLAFIVCFFDSDCSIQQQLIRFHLLAKSLTDDEIGYELISILSVQYNSNI